MNLNTGRNITLINNVFALICDTFIFSHCAFNEKFNTKISPRWRYYEILISSKCVTHISFKDVIRKSK